MGIPGLDVVAPAVGGIQAAQWWGRTEEEILQLPGYRRLPDGSKHPDDIALAKQLMADAGFPDGFTVEANATPLRTDIAVLIADQLKQTLNITIDLSIIDSSHANTTRLKRKTSPFLLVATPLRTFRRTPGYPRIICRGPLRSIQNAWDVPDWFEAAYWEQAQDARPSKT